MTINDNLEFGMYDIHKQSSFGTPTKKEKNSYNISKNKEWTQKIKNLSVMLICKGENPLQYTTSTKNA